MIKIQIGLPPQLHFAQSTPTVRSLLSFPLSHLSLFCFFNSVPSTAFSTPLTDRRQQQEAPSSTPHCDELQHFSQNFTWLALSLCETSLSPGPRCLCFSIWSWKNRLISLSAAASFNRALQFKKMDFGEQRGSQEWQRGQTVEGGWSITQRRENQKENSE